MYRLLILTATLALAGYASAGTITLAAGCSCTDLITTLNCLNVVIPNLVALGADCPDLTTITLNNNQLTSVPGNFTTGLTKLTSINLSNNRIATIGAGAFTTGSPITTLNLGTNFLTSIGAGIFNHPNVQTIDLSNNRITAIDGDAFASATAVTRIQLNNNQLLALSVNTFNFQRAMTQLNLQVNNLTTLPEDLFRNTTAITTLTLANNRLNDFNSLPPLIFSRMTLMTTITLENNPLPILDANLFTSNRAITSFTCTGFVTCQNNSATPRNISCTGATSLTAPNINIVINCPLTNCGFLVVQRGSGSCGSATLFGNRCTAVCDSQFRAGQISAPFQCSTNGWVGNLACLGAPPICFGKNTLLTMADGTLKTVFELWRLNKFGQKGMKVLDVDGQPREVQNVVGVSVQDMLVTLPANSVAEGVPSEELVVTASHMLQLANSTVVTAGELAVQLGLPMQKPVPSTFVFHVQTESWGFLKVHGLGAESAAVSAADYEVRGAAHHLGGVPDPSCGDKFSRLQ